MSDYPEHDKQSAVLTESQAIGEFLDWLGQQGVMLMTYGKRTSEEPCQGTIFRMCTNGKTEFDTVCKQCGGTGWVKSEREGHWDWTPTSIQERLAKYFEIDLDKIEAERRQMLDSIRSTN